MWRSYWSCCSSVCDRVCVSCHVSCQVSRARNPWQTLHCWHWHLHQSLRYVYGWVEEGPNTGNHHDCGHDQDVWVGGGMRALRTTGNQKTTPFLRDPHWSAWLEEHVFGGVIQQRRTLDLTWCSYRTNVLCVAYALCDIGQMFVP